MSRAFAQLFLFLLVVLPCASPRAWSQARGARAGASPVKTPPAGVQPQVRRWLQSLSLEEKVAQLLVIPVYGDAPNVRSKEFQKVLRMVEGRKVGGLILINRMRNRVLKRAEPFAFAAFLNRMQRSAKIPLIVAGDFERGASMRVEGATLFPHAMAFAAASDPESTRFVGKMTAQEARALGVHWVLFPDADVNNNPDNPIINIRAFSENPEEVAAHVRAYIEGANSDPRYRVLTTAKHFPGHGDTAVDSHLNLSAIQADRSRLDSMELLPFRAAIAAGVDSVMSAHLSVPALDSPDLPATLSSKILTGLLRDEFGFKGLIVTDALDMGGVAKGFSVGEAAVRAMEAGADVLLMPPDPEAAIRAVVAAVRAKRISEARLQSSLVRWLSAKQRLGLDKERYVNIEKIEEIFDSPEAAERALDVTQRAVTLLRNENAILPLKPGDGACSVLLTENRYGTQGLAFLEEARKHDAEATVVLLDPLMPQPELDAAALQLSACSRVVAVAFASVVEYRSGDILPGSYSQLIQKLIDSGKPVALAALGSPYLIRKFDKVAAYLTTYTPVATAETAAVRVLYGEVKPQGRLPVTIPGIARPGDGLTYP